MKKFNIFFDFEKEEQWLNDQLQKGYRCTNISALGIYTFEKTDKSYVLRLDYQDYLSKERFKHYKETYEDFGWSYINSPCWLGGTRYWQKEGDNKNVIFSDRQSKRNYYRKLMYFSAVVSVMLLFISYLIYQDTGFYFAEGLSGLSGSLFWIGFILEIPFLLLSNLPLIICAFSSISFYKAYRNYWMLKEA
ncbi:Protein of unknown function [Terribacillus aidingensis]|uniref:DUF2812 domain-containing protein n=1 Tax=Terribacillus aidingensis TaxID=586416 RepID=A0A285NM25_9BACI|nr:DUF2812 domain-containing protein [Terribacillus aidingensis]SNZ10519.1 Protein of unknown function [Terribacillus aidingensis]